jgi:hypothetical protein
MAIITWPYKDPDEVLDYEIDWTAKLTGGDTITSSSWTVPAGITKDSSTFTTSTATIWLSDGTIGETYLLTNEVTTAAGRTMDQSAKLKIKEK